MRVIKGWTIAHIRTYTCIGIYRDSSGFGFPQSSGVQASNKLQAHEGAFLLSHV